MNTTAPRPTERAAAKGANSYRQQLPPTANLLTGKLIATLVGDRHGLQLFTCALDRATGLARWEQ
ncbi:hypothetical protein [Streptomyces canus]|uniref:hypothetical protein n=1 Tax=Streptomyces canus TaxID=58343 RepID=UPI000380949E|nr:hypothetical protein [Streptomyces canus]